jgi:glycosyltransferase involved in cell wall biosynthesis
VIIGIDMLGLQSSDSRIRGIGRYGFNLLRTLFERHAGHEYVLYRHEGLRCDGLPEPQIGHWRALPGALPSRRDSPASVDMDHLVAANPDSLDVLLILSPFEWQNRYIPPARTHNRPKTATIVFDLIPMQFQEQYLSDSSSRRWFSRWVKLLNAQDLLLTCSESTRTDLLEILKIDPRRVVAIGAASDPGFFVPAPGGRAAQVLPEGLRVLGIGQPFVLNVSGNDQRKNALGLVEAFARLPRRLRETHQLVIACGLTPDRIESIRSLARARGVLDQVILTGAVSDETLQLLYQNCATFVFPSLYEGFGLPILEAMHCGAPVIVGNNSSQIEVAEGAGLLVNATDPAELAAKIELVLEGAGVADRLRALALARAAEFDWAHVVDRLARALEGLVGSEARPRRRWTSTRPQIALVAPSGPQCPDRAQAVERLAEGLLDHYAIDIYTESALVTPLGLRSERVGCFHHTLFDRNATYKQYRAVLCFLGNALEYDFVLDFLERHRAIAVLQDFALTRLHLGRGARRGGVAAVLDVVQSCSGVRFDALRPALDRLAGDPEALLPVLDALGLAWNRMVFEWAEAVVVTSASGLDRARELGPQLIERARVIPWGVDPSGYDPERRAATRTRLGLSPEALVVGVFGSPPTGPRAAAVLEGISALCCRRSDAQLCLVTTDAIPAALGAQVERLGCGGRIRSLGRRSIEERDELIGAVDIAVVCQDAGPFPEISPLLATVLATGVPAIVDERGGLDGDLAPLVRRYDWADGGAAGLIGHLMAIAEVLPEARTLAGTAREIVVKRQGWAQVTASYGALIESSAAGRGRAVRLPHFRPGDSRHRILVN